MANRKQTPSGTGSRFPHLSSALQRMAAANVERFELDTISRQLGRRSIGALLLVLALPMALPIPTPGLSVLFGLPLVLVSAQLMLGRRSAWLPRRLARRSIARADFVEFVKRAMPTLHFLERFVRPRMPWMAGHWAMIPVGATCLILALIIALPIPLGHVVPGAAISVLAIGVVERDGVAIAAGFVVALIGLTIVALASAGLVVTLRAWLPI